MHTFYEQQNTRIILRRHSPDMSLKANVFLNLLILNIMWSQVNRELIGV